jgi:long-chain acyl-CoA synthetase
MNLAHLLARAGRVAGAENALAIGTSHVATYRELAGQAAALGGGLASRHGMAQGARVALLMSNSPDYVRALFGCWWAGLIAVPINNKLHAREIAVILADSGAATLLVTPELEGVAGEAARIAGTDVRIVTAGGSDWRALLAAERAPMADAGRDTPAWLFYTSGTTGRPKGATLSHGNLRAMCGAFTADVDTIAPGDALLHVAPMSHGSGLYILPYVAGFGRQVIPESGGFEPDEIWDLLPACPALSFFAAPTMVGRLIRSPRAGDANTHNLKTIVYGGGPMYVTDTIAALDLLGPKLAQIYGQGESPMTITALPKHLHVGASAARLGSVGYAQSAVEVITADAQGSAAPLGEVGEILVRGETVMLGYWNDPTATARALRDGWLATGDIGTFDADGFLTLKDRSKDVIISGGSNIYPREVEEVLLQHPDVSEVSVIGRPHPDWGEEVVAFVVAAPGLSRETLDRLCTDNIARFKRPKEYRFVAALPKNAYGKVLKTELRLLAD